MVQVSQGVMQDPIPKIRNAKRSGGVAQMAECLPSKLEILS
jgi:hypothetical protein